MEELSAGGVEPWVNAPPAVLIVNTRSRVGEGMFEAARQALAALKVPLLEAIALDHPERLQELVRAAVSGGARRVIVGGGDGTLSGAAHVLSGTGIELGVLPCGTANDFARSLHIPVRIEEACAVIRDGYTRQVDLGLVNGHHFLNAASVGVTSDIARNVNKGLKRRLGKVAYATAAASEAFKLSPFHARIVAETGTLDLECAQVVIGNGRYHGGGSMIAPEATLEDQLLDVYVIAFDGKTEDERLRVRDLLSLGRIAMLVRRGRHVDHAAVQHLRTRRLRLDTDPALELDVDGEPLGTTPATFEVVPRALTVIAPRPAH